MATVAEFTVDTLAFPFGNLFEEFPEATVEIERIIPTGDAVMPYLWTDGASHDEVEEQLLEEERIEDITIVETLGDRSLLRCTYIPSFEGILKAIVDTEVTLLSAVGTEDGWTIQIRGVEPGAITAFDEACRESGVSLTLNELHELAAETGQASSELTPKQRNALVLAYEMGYYDDPRTASLEEIAAELDISRQALADRLRRGYRSLIESDVILQ